MEVRQLLCVSQASFSRHSYLVRSVVTLPWHTLDHTSAPRAEVKGLVRIEGFGSFENGRVRLDGRRSTSSTCANALHAQTHHLREVHEKCAGAIVTCSLHRTVRMVRVRGVQYTFSTVSRIDCGSAGVGRITAALRTLQSSSGDSAVNAVG